LADVDATCGMNADGIALAQCADGSRCTFGPALADRAMWWVHAKTGSFIK